MPRDPFATRPLPSFDVGLNWPTFRQPRLSLGLWRWPEPALPYAWDDLSPVIEEVDLKEHVHQFAARYAERYNRAAQLGEGGARNLRFAWGGLMLHHLFFWGMLHRGRRPTEGPLVDMLAPAGGIDGWIDVMCAEGARLQGSGWLCLAARPSYRLHVLLLPNHDLRPLKDSTPLVVVDLWEHSFIPGYRSKRATYVRDVLRRLVDWQVAQERFVAAMNRSRRTFRVNLSR